MVELTVLCSMISLSRVELKKKVVDGPEIAEMLHQSPTIQGFLAALHSCEYADFFRLLGDACACLWEMRAAHAPFALWLAQALEADGVPRRGVGAEAKAAFAQALLAATTKAHFKATVKQFCGGKKKGTHGTPTAPSGADP